MNGRLPAATAVIPTRNRAASLGRTLDALARQDLPLGDLEVVVVDDGDAALPAGLAARPGVRVLPNEGRGAAAARNTGARAARAPLLLFLDDDIEASPGLVRAHVEARRAGASLSIGYMPARPAAATGFFAVTLRNWWEAMFAEMRRPGHRFTFRDVLTGNCAIDASLFRRLGGFDASFTCHEDYELGFRAIQAGARVVFCAGAEGIHHEVTTLERSLDRKRAEGQADAMLVTKHPELLAALPIGAARHARLGEPGTRARRVFTRPRAEARFLARQRRHLRLFEAARMRGRWLQRLYAMLDLTYWQGVVTEVGTLDALGDLVDRANRAAARATWWLRVDLADGLDAVERSIDEARPDGLVVSCQGRPVGTVPPSVGAEPLRGAHLRAQLAGPLAWPLVVALGRAGAADVVDRAGRLEAPRLPRDTPNLDHVIGARPVDGWCSAASGTRAARPPWDGSGAARVPR